MDTTAPYKIKLSRMDRAVSRLVYQQRRKFVGAPVRVLLWALGVEVPRQVTLGPGLTLGHPTVGVVVHPRTIVGANVAIFHGVTIGRGDSFRPEPVGVKSRVIVEDNVVIAAGAVILFRPGQDLVIGEGAVIGANAVVTRSVPAGEVWAGNPAKAVTTR